MSTDRTQAIRTALEMRDGVHMATSYLIAYEYLDPDGRRCVGFSWPTDQGTLVTYALGAAAGRLAERTLDDWLEDE